MAQSPHLTPAVRPQAGAQAIAVCVYLVTLASMATVGVIVPLMGKLADALGASMAELGFTVGLYSLPSALLSLAGGSVVDRIGPKPALIGAATFALIADVVILQGHSLIALQAAMLIAGIANAGIIISVPALLMTALQGPGQVRAMSLWSTYGPAGYALGLLLSAPFVDGPHWRLAVVVLAGFMAFAMLAALLLLPNIRRETSGGLAAVVGRTLSVLKELPLLRVSIAYALASAVSYGSGLAAPGYLARTYDVSIAISATAIAAAKIAAMLLGGLGMGWLLNGERDRFAMFALVAALGVVAQGFLYFPNSGMIAATSAMIVWLFMYGAMSAVSFVTLAQVNRDPDNSGVASGLIGQLGSIGCFLAPTIYFALTLWSHFVLVALAGLVLALLAFPRRGAAPA